MSSWLDADYRTPCRLDLDVPLAAGWAALAQWLPKQLHTAERSQRSRAAHCLPHCHRNKPPAGLCTQNFGGVASGAQGQQGDVGITLSLFVPTQVPSPSIGHMTQLFIGHLWFTTQDLLARLEGGRMPILTCSASPVGGLLKPGPTQPKSAHTHTHPCFRPRDRQGKGLPSLANGSTQLP